MGRSSSESRRRENNGVQHVFALLDSLKVSHCTSYNACVHKEAYSDIAVLCMYRYAFYRNCTAKR